MNKKEGTLKRKAKSGTKGSLSFAIERIELKNKNISTYPPTDGDNIVLKLSIDITSDLAKSFLLITVDCKFLLDENDEILSFSIVNIYHIPNLKSFIVIKNLQMEIFLNTWLICR